MAGTTTTSASGIQQRLIAEAFAYFRHSSTLFNAVDAIDAGNATTVRFQTRAVPAAVSAHTETASLSAVATTITEIDAVLQEYPILKRVSKLAWPTPGLIQAVAEDAGGALARSADTAIATIFQGFDNTVGDVSQSMVVQDIFSASAQLDASGYVGDKVCVLHPASWQKVAEDVLGYNPSSKGEEFLVRGYVSNIGGIDIYVSPWVTTAGLTVDYYYNAVYFKHAIGFGYRSPFISFDQVLNLTYNSVDVLGAAYFKAMEVTDGAGRLIYDNKP